MPRILIWLLISLMPSGFACAAEKPREITDPAKAAKDPDFAVQGEYIGEGIWMDGEKTKVGAQVIALGKGEFTAVVYKGGLPGDGWRRGDPIITTSGKREEGITKLSGAECTGTIGAEMMSIAGEKGRIELRLDRTVRHSPTEGAKPPEGAVVLFDGTSAEHFLRGRLSQDHNLKSDVETKRMFDDYTLHLEFRLSYMPEARGQARSNSGLYLHDCYEVQVLDSFGLEGENNECGGFYQLRKPDVNMCFPPLTWQTYDVEFTAPRYKDGKKTSDARVEVRHNGVAIHPEFALEHATPGRRGEGPPPRPIFLQGHGNNVRYRNIWLVPKSRGTEE
ncbi:MAG: DUF1080 domain-containing protein [Pirellulales bacterium]|nr:DUF1080 domain-containing protein [Pirellulales bacterium]